MQALRTRRRQEEEEGRSYFLNFMHGQLEPIQPFFPYNTDVFTMVELTLPKISIFTLCFKRLASFHVLRNLKLL